MAPVSGREPDTGAWDKTDIREQRREWQVPYPTPAIPGADDRSRNAHDWPVEDRRLSGVAQIAADKICRKTSPDGVSSTFQSDRVCRARPHTKPSSGAWDMFLAELRAPCTENTCFPTHRTRQVPAIYCYSKQVNGRPIPAAMLTLLTVSVITIVRHDSC